MEHSNRTLTSTISQFLDEQLSKGRKLEEITSDEINIYLNKYPDLPKKTPREISAFKANYKKRSSLKSDSLNKVSSECTLDVRISKERYVKVVFDKEPKVVDIDRLIQYLEMIKEDFTDVKDSKTFTVPF